MSQPLALPSAVKRIARVIRDNPRTNNLITSILKPFIKIAPSSARSALAAHFPRVGMVSANLPDGRTFKMSSPAPESIVNSIFYGDWTGEEAEVLPLWYEFAKRADVVVDIGAHIGHFSVVAGVANRAARIFAFEPLPRIAALLQSNAKLNNLDNLTVRNLALGREVGTVPFYAVAEGLPSSSSLSKEFMTSGDNEFVAIDVQVSRLDEEIIPRAGGVLVKMDTETTEPDVVAGGRSFLREAQPIIFVEILDKTVAQRFTDELAAADYFFTPYLLSGDGPKKSSAIRADPRWHNYLLIPVGEIRGKMGDALSEIGIIDSR